MSRIMWGKSGAVYNNFFCVLCKTRRYDLTCLISPFLLTKLASLANLALFTNQKVGLWISKSKNGDHFLLPTVQFSSMIQNNASIFSSPRAILVSYAFPFYAQLYSAMHSCRAGYDEEYVLRCTLEERCPVIGEVQLGQKLYPPNRPLSPPAVWANRGFFFGENLQNLQNSVF